MIAWNFQDCLQINDQAGYNTWALTSNASISETAGDYCMAIVQNTYYFGKQLYTDFGDC